MVRRVVDLHPAAIAEGRDAREYYLAKSSRAEEHFRLEVEHAVALIRDHPETWPRYIHGTRRFILRTFPYSIVYNTDGAYTVIVAIAHARRRPGYWKGRLR